MDIDAKGLSVNFGSNSVLKSLSFSISSGSFVALLGPNGSGKSTLLKAIAGLTKFKGDLLINSKKTKGFLRENFPLSYVPQNLSIPHGMTVSEYVMLGRVSNSNWFFGERKDDYDAVETALDALDLSSRAKQLVSTLSGGEMQRETLARALAQEAKVLLLDEPTAAMDFARAIESIQLLDSLRENYNLTIVIATHDINSVCHYANLTLILKDGNGLYAGEFSNVLEKKFLGNLYDTEIEFFRNDKGELVIFSSASDKLSIPVKN